MKTCRHCGLTIMQDGEGNWYHGGTGRVFCKRMLDTPPRLAEPEDALEIGLSERRVAAQWGREAIIMKAILQDLVLVKDGSEPYFVATLIDQTEALIAQINNGVKLEDLKHG